MTKLTQEQHNRMTPEQRLAFLEKHGVAKKVGRPAEGKTPVSSTERVRRFRKRKRNKDQGGEMILIKAGTNHYRCWLANDPDNIRGEFHAETYIAEAKDWIPVRNIHILKQLESDAAAKASQS